ncbi:MAG: hypothetical protein RJB39_589 [Candidatus Parcubacteria bacterium]|jgi:hypothetical protein
MKTPLEIIEEVKKITSPYQQKLAEKTYQDTKVDWRLRFRWMDESDFKPEYFLICATIDQDSYTGIYVCFNVKKDLYPEFKHLNSNDKLYVEGKIEDVNGFNIDLKDCVVRFKEEKDDIKKNYSISAPINNSNIIMGDGKIHNEHVGRDKIEMKKDKIKWHEGLFGIIIVGVIIGIIIAGVSYLLGWN